MDYNQFKQELYKLNISVAQFARLIDRKPNTLTNYKQSNKMPIHLTIIIRLMVKLSDLGADPSLVIADLTNDKTKKASLYF